MRKIIQVATLQGSNKVHESVFALCDDGKLFYTQIGGTEWSEAEPIPQDGEENEPST